MSQPGAFLPVEATRAFRRLRRGAEPKQGEERRLQMPGPRAEDEEETRRTERSARLRAAIDAENERDLELLGSLRRGDSAAYEAYLERFHRLLLDYARRTGVSSADEDEFVEELLDDVALQVMMPGARLPKSPRLYLLRAFRNKLLNAKRARGRRERVVRDATGDASALSAAGGVELVAGCSQGMVREARGPGWERPPLGRVLERLAAKLGERLTDDERLMLDAVAENVPQREIAEWLGVSHVVARKRLERLRARLIDISMRFASGLEPDDARELQRFFRRCRARIGTSMITGLPHAREDDAIRGNGVSQSKVHGGGDHEEPSS